MAGICEVPPNPAYTYDDRYNYAHGFGPVTWHDWGDVSQGWSPAPPSRAPAACHVDNDHDRIENLFRAFIQRRNRILAMDEWAELLAQQGQLIFTGPPGTGKTLEAKRLAARLITGQVPPIEAVDETLVPLRSNMPDVVPGAGGAWDIVQFHPSYNYDDFVRGIRIDMQPGGPTYRFHDGPLLLMAQAARDSNGKFVLIIDEINRANVAAVLGELIYALEYRRQPVTLQYGGVDAKAIIPANLFIIGTMNTADRSIGHLDYAVRRRFAFVPLEPSRDVVSCNYSDGTLRDYALAKFDTISKLFVGDESLLTSDYHASDIQPGHSYFLADRQAIDRQANLNRKIRYQVVPLLREYVADGVLRSEAVQRIDEIERELAGGGL